VVQEQNPVGPKMRERAEKTKPDSTRFGLQINGYYYFNNKSDKK
jgi:hypothetical protein